jgi:antitoxin component YwqK of YwqJK toxin-antitoxin module
LSKGTYINGDKEGTWVSYTADGILLKRQTGQFKNGIKISD